MKSGENKNSRDAGAKAGPQAAKKHNKTLLKAIDLKRKFSTSEGEIEILRGINLEIAENDMISVVGASGAGKSTLLYLLSGLDKPTGGQIMFEDRDISSMNEYELSRFRNKNIGFVYQFHYLLSEFSALENVMMPLLISGESKKPAESKAYNILERLDLKDRAGHRPGKLSGGEQQRVAVARALATSPRIVFADEPSGNLDEKTADSLHDLLVETNKTTGVTFLIATHNLGLARKADRMFELSAGTLRQK